MSNETLTIAHTSTDCAAKAAGICERVHIGDVVRVVIEQVGYMTVGTVLSISLLGGIEVNFPDGAMNADDYDMTQEETEVLYFIESELELVSV